MNTREGEWEREQDITREGHLRPSITGNNLFQLIANHCCKVQPTNTRDKTFPLPTHGKNVAERKCWL